MDFGLYRVQGEEDRLSFHKRLALHGRPGGRLFLFLTSGGSRREIDTRQDHRSARCPQQRKTLVQDDIGQQNGTHGFRKDEKPTPGEFAFLSIFDVPRPRFWRTMILKFSEGLKSQVHTKAR